MDISKLITTIIGAVIMILGITGVITAEEGTALSTNGINVAQGVLGLVVVIKEIIGRHKKPTEIAGPADPVKKE